MSNGAHDHPCTFLCKRNELSYALLLIPSTHMFGPGEIPSSFPGEELTSVRVAHFLYTYIWPRRESTQVALSFGIPERATLAHGSRLRFAGEETRSIR